MASYGSGVKGLVRVLATVSSIAESLPDDVAGFLREPKNRDIRVDIEERSSRDVIRGLREGSASVGICWDAADMEGLQTVPYGSDHLAVIAYPSHPLAGLKSVRFEETLAYDHVGLPASTAVFSMLGRVAAMSGTVLSYRSVVTTFEAALRVVRAELGISVVPKEIAQTFVGSLGLKIIPLEDAWARRTFAICFRDAASLSSAGRLLVDHLSAKAHARSAA
jgi:DNA-binding transcriptional LysR family regulator